MKSSNVQPSPFRNGATTGGLMWAADILFWVQRLSSILQVSQTWKMWHNFPSITCKLWRIGEVLQRIRRLILIYFPIDVFRIFFYSSSNPLLPLFCSVFCYILLIRRNLSIESFGTLSKLVEEELGNTVMAGRRGDLESVAFTHEDFGPETIDHNGEDNIVSVLYAGKTKKGFGECTWVPIWPRRLMAASS